MSSQQDITNSLQADMQLETKGYTLQDAYKKIGGMGKWILQSYSIGIFYTGRFHYFSSAMLIMGFMSGSFLGQQMQFVEYTPKYLCSNNTDFSDPYVCVADASKSSNPSIPNWC